MLNNCVDLVSLCDAQCKCVVLILVFNPSELFSCQALVLYSASVFCTSVYRCTFLDLMVNVCANFLSHLSYESCVNTCFAWKCASLTFQPKCFACLCNCLLFSVSVLQFHHMCDCHSQHLATCVAEWQKPNTIMSCSTYAVNVNIEQLNCLFFWL